MGLISFVSDVIGIQQDGIRLLASILAGYPFAAVYRNFLFNKPANVQHWYFVIVGLCLYVFNCGIQIYHSLISIVIAYFLCKLYPGTKLSVGLAHFFFLGHLMVGYWFWESHGYDITWTTPFCIMCLRLTGLVMDVYDGKKPQEWLKADQRVNCVPNPPGLLEIAAYSFFFSGTLVGPQFPLNRFRHFVRQDYLDPNTKRPRSSALKASLARFLAAVCYSTFHQWGEVFVPTDFISSDQFVNDTSFIMKCVWIVLWMKFVMARYCSAWLFTEGAAILSGIAYNGKDSFNQDRWDGVRDIKILQFEFGIDFQSMIDSFNCGTNTFARNHVFRRLRWLGNKNLSQAATLVYLAVWHGYHLGYFVLFSYEFACMAAQEQLYNLIKRRPTMSSFLKRRFVLPVCYLFGRMTVLVSASFAFLSFGLVKKEIWIRPIKSMYFSFWILYFLVLPVFFQIMRRVLPEETKTSKKEPRKTN